MGKKNKFNKNGKRRVKKKFRKTNTNNTKTQHRQKQPKPTFNKGVQVGPFSHLLFSQVVAGSKAKFTSSGDIQNKLIKSIRTIKKACPKFAEWIKQVNQTDNYGFVKKVFCCNDALIPYSVLFLMFFLEKNGIETYLGGGAVRDILIRQLVNLKENEYPDKFLQAQKEDVINFKQNYNYNQNEINDFDLIIKADNYKKILDILPKEITNIVGYNYKVVKINCDTDIDIGSFQGNLENYAKNRNIQYNALYWRICSKNNDRNNHKLCFDSVIDHTSGRLAILQMATETINNNPNFYFSFHPECLIRAIYSNSKTNFNFSKRMTKAITAKISYIYYKKTSIFIPEKGLETKYISQNQKFTYYYLTEKLFLTPHGNKSFLWLEKNNLLHKLFPMFSECSDKIKSTLLDCINKIIENNLIHSGKGHILFYATLLFLFATASNHVPLDGKTLVIKNSQLLTYVYPCYNEVNIIDQAIKTIFLKEKLINKTNEKIDRDIQQLIDMLNEIIPISKSLTHGIYNQK